ncbi:MAG: tetratricopeptide repeat protein [Acidobacteriaceae bacterium]
MRQAVRWIFVFAAMRPAAWVQAQVPTMPPGTTVPDTAPSPSQVPSGPSAQAAALVTKAENAIVHEDYGRALPLLNEALAKQPANSAAAARTLYDRGYVEQEQHRLTAAASDFRKANDANPKQFESRVALGRLLVQQQHWKQARQQLELAAGLQPASGDPRQQLAAVARTLARVDAQLHDPVAASDALIGALKMTPEEPDDTLLAARLAEEEGDRAGAEGEFRKALAAEPKSLEAAEGLARVLIQQGKFAQAEPVVQQALQQEPNDPTLLAQSATALAGEGKNQAAVQQLVTLHRQNPDQPAVTRMLADLYSATGDAAKAEPLYRQLIADDPKNTDLLTAQGENLIREQKWAEAVHALQHSLDLQPAQEDAWSGLAFAASEDHAYPLVLTALDQRARYLADGPATLFLRASALDHLHRNKGAILYYQKFLVAANGQFPDEEAQTRQRLKALRK